MGEIVNGRRLADMFDVSPRTVSSWRKAGLPVHEDKGRGRETLYDTGEAFRWLMARDNGNGKDPGTTAARRRLLEAEAGRREIRLARERGEVVLVDDSVKILEYIALAVRQRLLAFPAKASPQIVACNSISEVHSILMSVVHECLNELAAIEPSKGGNDG